MTQQQKTHHLGVIDKVGENIVKELGGHLTDDMHECTHLVTDKIRRTVKFLCAIVRGLRIVNQEWFRDSKKQSRFLAELSYENFNESSTQSIEARYGFTFTKTMAVARSRSQQLFSGHQIHVTKSVHPPPQEMYQMSLCPENAKGLGSS
ncbi:mediator of DNA damage checkpoint protein 1-like isoform X4 [Clavelina lepadiformis]|uniref:mediator of DNA damage checkpoint protein 1-like isoform X4 n=1 Tax=Clavelina lepadiformis TaxID=159417 RepID=UPI0040417F15